MLNDPTAPAAAPVTPDVDDLQATENAAATPHDEASAEQLEQLLVLSQAPLSLEEALEQEAAEATGEAAAIAPLTTGRLMGQFVKLLAQVLGVGLVTAAVRHYSDNPKLYLGVTAAGVLLFAIASTVLDRRAPGGKLAGVRYGALSALLALGLGLLVGGVLHFTAFPHTGAILVPLGLGLSIVAFVLRDGGDLVGRSFLSTAVTIVGILVWLGVGLGLAAKKLDPAPTPAAAHGEPAGHGDAAAGGHGEAAAGAHGEAAAEGHGEAAAGGHGAPAAGAHGEAAKAEHGAEAGAHGEAAKAEHGAAAAGDHAAAAEGDHAPAAKSAPHGTAAEGDHAAAKSDHGAAADAGHAAESNAASHGEAAAEHGTPAKGHGASASSHADEKEDEVSADDVLVPRAKKH